MCPDLDRKKLPLLHLIKICSLLGSELQRRLVMVTRYYSSPWSNIKQSVLLVLLAFFINLLFHFFEICLSVLFLERGVVNVVTFLIRAILILNVYTVVLSFLFSSID